MLSELKKLTTETVNAMSDAGVEKSSVTASCSRMVEYNFEFDEPTLLRTTQNKSIGLDGITDFKNASSSLNTWEQESIQNSVKELKSNLAFSTPDDGNDIAEAQPESHFTHGPIKPDKDLLYNRTQEVMDYTQKHFPKVKVEALTSTHATRYASFSNSNGTLFTSHSGSYGMSMMFSGKDGEETTSFDYFGVSCHDLDKAFLDYNSNKKKLEYTMMSFDAQKIPHKFEGQLVMMPGCAGEFVGNLLNFVSGGALISGKTPFKDHVGKSISSQHLTVLSRPHDASFTSKSYTTGDGYLSQPFDWVSQGNLNTYAISLYASKKLKKERSPNPGSALIIEPGSKTSDQLIESVKEGLLVGRFSGGSIGASGDFSGIAKNSFYIKDGKINHAIKETMISGNLFTMMNNILGMSSDFHLGSSSKTPFMMVDGITMS